MSSDKSKDKEIKQEDKESNYANKLEKVKSNKFTDSVEVKNSSNITPVIVKKRSIVNTDKGKIREIEKNYHAHIFNNMPSKNSSKLQLHNDKKSNISEKNSDYIYTYIPKIASDLYENKYIKKETKNSTKSKSKNMEINVKLQKEISDIDHCNSNNKLNLFSKNSFILTKSNSIVIDSEKPPIDKNIESLSSIKYEKSTPISTFEQNNINKTYSNPMNDLLNIDGQKCCEAGYLRNNSVRISNEKIYNLDMSVSKLPQIKITTYNSSNNINKITSSKEMLELKAEKLSLKEEDPNNEDKAESEANSNKIIFFESKTVKSNVLNDKIDKISEAKIHALEEDKQSQLKKQESGSINKVCRICYEGDKLNNYLIQPCRCEGSMKYIHEDCLKTWLDTLQKGLTCEICNQRFYIKFFMEKNKSKSLQRKYIKKLCKGLTIMLVVIAILYITIYFLINTAFEFTVEKNTTLHLILSISSLLVLSTTFLFSYCKYKKRWYSVNMKEWKIYDINQGKYNILIK